MLSLCIVQIFQQLSIFSSSNDGFQFGNVPFLTAGEVSLSAPINKHFLTQNLLWQKQAETLFLKLAGGAYLAYKF